MAKHENPAKPSLLLGHQNPALLWNTYRALVTKDEAERYWLITPTYDGSGKIVQRVSAEEIRRKRGARLAAALASE